MSTLPSATPRPLTLSHPLAHARFAALATLTAILGTLSIWPAAVALWALWVTDPLKSIGMLVPIASLVLILRAWSRLAWETEGTWWGLVLLFATAAAVYVREHAILVLVVAPQWNVYFPPNSLVAFAYVSGVVLLFGGPRLFRAALFPILLVFLVNPIPHIFNVLVDLPLQRVSAHVARAFAIALGQKLTPDQMRLMFTPDFGMFIAPGCNGIRGAVTMGMIALIVGYLYRFRAAAHAFFVVTAILLGYLFNFVRLCTLVLYYIVAVHLPRLQKHGEMADYIIGAALFLFATSLLLFIVRHSSRFTRPPVPSLSSQQSARETGAKPSFRSPSLSLRFAAITLLIFLGAASVVRSSVAAARSAPSDASTLGAFPARVGEYTLARSWNEYATAGPLVFQWADYAPAASGGTHIALGISPVLGSHDTLICHSARGEDPIWHAELPTSTAGTPTTFNASFFADGVSQYLEVTTLCQGGTCGEYSDNRRHFGFVYSRPSAASLFSQDPQRPIPVMLRAETTDTALPPDVARAQLTSVTQAFLSGLDLKLLLQPYQH